MRNYPEIGVQIGEILLPAPMVDLQKWAVIACDQFTSQPEYWQKVSEMTQASPSTLDLILPEVYLNSPLEKLKIHSTQAAMQRFLAENILLPHTGLVFVEREVGGRVRRGLMIALDLEQYDFNKGSQSLIRATEGTILNRLPPRIRIREDASLEVPHILVLIDDPDQTVIEPLIEKQADLKPLYDVELMLGSGHLRGRLVDSPADELRITQALKNLADPQHFQDKYGVTQDHGVLLFAVGDGNHSLATAKSIWEKIKESVGPEHPARYALVEIENVHDTGLVFEPIHRVLFNVNPTWKTDLAHFYKDKVGFQNVSTFNEMVTFVKNQNTHQQYVGVISQDGFEVVNFQDPSANLAVGTLQTFLDTWLNQGGAGHIDYVHGDKVVHDLSRQPGNLGFYLPVMDKSALFKTVILDGSLPRKTFSMGEAHEKRFYMECRRIS